jgi:DNA modification methylase
MPRDVVEPATTDVMTPAVLLLTGNAETRLKALPDASVHCCTTSPGYFGLRNYGTATWDGGDANCDHALPDDAGQSKKHTAGMRSHPGRHTGPTCPKCGAKRIDQQIGLEATPGEYVERLVAVFREVRRILRDDGTLWITIGDSYASKTKGSGGTGKSGLMNDGRDDDGRRTADFANSHARFGATKFNTGDAKDGDLMMIPEMVAIALRADGWFLRSKIAWTKGSVMPESCTNRPSSAHETVFMLTKAASGVFWWHRDGYGARTQPKPDWRWVDALDASERATEPEGEWKKETLGDAKRWRRENLWHGEGNFYDLEAVKENAVKPPQRMQASPEAVEAKSLGPMKRGDDGPNHQFRDPNRLWGDGGRQMRNTWEIEEDEAQPLSDRWMINPEPIRDQHYAAFPTRLASRCIQASTSDHGCCGNCGAPYRRVVEKDAADAAHQALCGADSTGGYDGTSRKDYATAGAQDASATKARILAGMRMKRTAGWAPTCGCDPFTSGVVPCVVLDPFSGTGTSGLSAVRLGRDYIGIDLNAEYNSGIAAKRITDPKGKCINSAGERLPFRACTIEVG